MKFNFLKLTLFITIIIGLTACGNSADNSKEYKIEKSTKKYNISVFKQLTKEEADDLFQSDKVEIVFICTGADAGCQKIRNFVEDVQNDFNYVTNYIYIHNNFTEEFKSFLSKLDLYYKLEEGIEGTFYDLLGKNVMYFPAFAIIENGKQVDGFIGHNVTYDDIHEMVSKYLD